MNLIINENELTFENGRAYARLAITDNTGTGILDGKKHLRAYTKATILDKQSDQVCQIRLTVYWDSESTNAHFIFTAGSIKGFIEENGLEWKEFKDEFWSQVKRITTLIFDENQIKAFRKAR